MSQQLAKEMAAEYAARLYALAPVSVAGMFGGASLRSGGIVFGLIIDQELYFRVDAQSMADYKAAGSAPFSYARKDGREITVGSYYNVPADVLEDDALLNDWGKTAHRAAFDANIKKKPKKKKKAVSRDEIGRL
jgi:DNA transformation protein